jgi:multidrug efflux pump subunit AcrB
MILSRRFVVRTGLVCALAAKAGDPLAIIDPRTLQAQLAEQRAARAKDEALLQGTPLDLKRYEDLSRRDFASRQPVDQQRAQVDQYRAQIDSDQARIDYAQTQLGGLQAGLEIDWVRAAAMGVTPLAVDNTLYDAFGQRQIRTIYLPHNYSPVILEAGPTMQADPASLNTVFVPGTGGG